MTQTEALKVILGDFLVKEKNFDETVLAIKKALVQPEQEPVAYLVTGPYEKMAFSDIGSANAYCGGLNKGFDTDAYLVSPLYTTPPQRKPMTDEQAEALIEDLAEWSQYVEVDTAHQSLGKHVRQVLAAHGIKE